MTPEEIAEFKAKIIAIDKHMHMKTAAGDQSQAGATVTTEQLLADPNFPKPGSGIASISDVEAFYNMRQWLTDAVEAKGAKVDGAGIGCGQADIDIMLEGHRYNISIRPLP